ncbi:MHS family MFS transporter [Corynebacterium propinquum]|uniref:MFS transporter n=1 Tax=Corynebacterium propinquum TaxID=43769 RepID=A0ABT7G3G7_9CORY|nr:MFS transporter [Corynebacterium propinquum]MDK4300826.1 MFS transporter [Corynebacterium propinquum]MDK4313227.1 MFS transporter [Corynebacterium propinquum]WKS32863.1 MHS family MFS transporter [Corynebacterium propinquum]WKS37319.1 MHS family MFS transporter [Corynebacterium propinquum]WKS39231.1 MHS family MFS transporter [Corynebacterium propinquum]
MSVTPTSATISAKERRRVVAATTIGTAIEWYDYFLYAAVAGLVFNQLMFGPLEGGLATIVSFASVGLSFLFRPLGAFLAGHFGDKVGRRTVLMVTLFAMGGATTLIGLLPTYDTWGIWAPILLITLRIIQGISAGGEWGSAVLLAVEHAPNDKRGLYGAGPQIGVPIGLLMSSGVLSIMNTIAPGDAFLEWGWRIPFLFSIVLVIVGYVIRMGVDESPVFQEISERKDAEASNPIGILFKRYLPLVLTAALVFAGNGTVGYMTTGGYIQNYTTNPDGPIGLARGDVLNAVTLSAVTWMLSTLFAGWVSDYIGRRMTYLIGFILQGIGAAALFPLVNTGSLGMLYLALIGLTVGLGLTYGPQSALYAELFPASIRASGVSITYAIGSVLGGAFAPMIAAALLEATGTTFAISGYLVSACIVGFICVFLLRERKGIPLGPEHEHEQMTGHFTFGAK